MLVSSRNKRDGLRYHAKGTLDQAGLVRAAIYDRPPVCPLISMPYFASAGLCDIVPMSPRSQSPLLIRWCLLSIMTRPNQLQEGLGAGAVLARQIRSGCTTISFGYPASGGAAMRRSSVSAASIPISRSGCLTVVSAGF